MNGGASTTGTAGIFSANAGVPDLCVNAAPGGAGENVDIVTLDGGGGGGGGGGGTFSGAPSVGFHAPAGSQFGSGQSSQGGHIGDSCTSGRAEGVVYLEGGSSGTGGINPSTALSPSTPISAKGGQVALSFAFDPARTAEVTALTENNVTVVGPSSKPPGYEVTGYSVTCQSETGGAPVSGGISGSTPLVSPYTINMHLPNGHAWSCQAVAIVANLVTGDAVNTIPVPRTIVPAAPSAAPIPTINEWGALLLSAIIWIFGVSKIRRRVPPKE